MRRASEKFDLGLIDEDELQEKMEAAEQLGEQRAAERVEEVKAKVEYKQKEMFRVSEAKTAGMKKWAASLAKIRLCIQVAQHVHVLTGYGFNVVLAVTGCA